MPRQVQALIVVCAVLLAGCPGSIDDPALFRNAAVTNCPSDFNVEEDLFRDTCGASTCHTGGANLAAAGLDLTSAGVVERLRTHVSTSRTAGCSGRPMFGADLASSFFMDKLNEDPECDAPMPYLGSPLNSEERVCLEAYLVANLGIPAGSDGGTPEPQPQTDGGTPQPQMDSGTPTPTPAAVTIQAEAMTLTGYTADAANAGMIRLPDGTTMGSASTAFSGVAGSYQMRVHVMSEPDGQPTLRIRVGTQQVAMETYPLVDNRMLVLGPFPVQLTAGAMITLDGTADVTATGSAWARIDRVELTP